MFRLGERAAARREAGPTLFIPKFVPPADGCQLLAAALSAIHRAGAASAGDQNVETQFSLKSIHWIDFHFHRKCRENGGRYKDRTCDPYDVNVVLYR